MVSISVFSDVDTHRELHRCSKVPPSSVTVDWDILEDGQSGEGKTTLQRTHTGTDSYTKISFLN